MAMKALNPCPKEVLPVDGWEVLSTEAGRYANGLRFTAQLWNHSLQATAQIVVTKPESWSVFVAEVVAKTSMPTADVAEMLYRLAGTTEGAYRELEREMADRAPSQATALIELADEVELFHDQSCNPYATIAVDGHHETWLVKSKGFRRWLARQYYLTYGKAVVPEYS
jgi:hypothetical protein